MHIYLGQPTSPPTLIEAPKGNKTITYEAVNDSNIHMRNPRTRKLWIDLAIVNFFLAHYILANDGSKDCTVGSKPVSKKECEKAAKELGKHYVKGPKLDEAIRPAGCHVWMDNKVYWNHHLTGSTFPSAQSVCKRGIYFVMNIAFLVIVNPFVVCNERVLKISLTITCLYNNIF